MLAKVWSSWISYLARGDVKWGNPSGKLFGSFLSSSVCTYNLLQ